MLSLSKKKRFGWSRTGSAAIGVFTCLVVLQCVYSCGRSAKLPLAPEIVDPTPDALANGNEQPGGFGIPDPLSLMEQHGVANIPDGWVRNGDEFERLLPYNRVVPSSGIGMYLPAYIPGAGVGLAGLAYALYVFDPGEFDGSTTIHFSWEAPPTDFSQFYVGVGNFGRNKWDWFQPGSASRVFLDSFEPYRRVEVDGAVILAVAMTGGNRTRLKHIQFGAGIPTDTIYAVPENTLIEAGENVRVDVFVRETAFPMGPVSVRVLVAEGNEFVQDSFNLGITGGTPGNMDGVWAYYGDTVALFDNYVGGLNAPAGYTALDFVIAPFSDNSIENASGGLFNFELQINRRTDLLIQRTSEDNGLDRTYYSNHIDSNEHYWANDTNRGMPGIRIIGYPVAVLEVDVSAGDTPLEVQFDASESYDEESGVITRYEFDFGEGEGYQDFGTNPLANYVYIHHGEVFALLRVTNIAGLTDYTTVSINAKRYDEIEDNDSLETANALPPFPFFGFRGNVGEGGEGEQYNGDNVDYFALDLNAGVNYRFILDLENPVHDSSTLHLLDKNDRYMYGLTFKWWMGNRTYLDYKPQVDELPLTLSVWRYADGEDYLLTGMRWPPTAVLENDLNSGELPFTVELDASGSWDAEDKAIVRYEFDFRDGAGFVDNGANPIASHTYLVKGFYEPIVKVFDDEGNYDVEKAMVYAGAEFDEIEPNTSLYPQHLMLPVTGFRGSCGFAYDDEKQEYTYRGYDGSSYDYYRFEAATGETIHATLVLQERTGYLALYLYSSKGKFLAKSNTNSETEELSYTLLPEDAGIIRLSVSQARDGTYAEYVMSIEAQ